jgi:hypothetical protein
MATLLPLAFDHSRPFGPLVGDETCTTGLKTVSFSAPWSRGYEFGMQLTRLSNELSKHHVFSLKLTSLQQEYGWNAVAIVMNKFTDNPSTDDMFRSERPSYNLWIYSQFTCPWKDTLLTFVISPGESKVDVYVEQAFDVEARKERGGTDGNAGSSKKRKHDEVGEHDAKDDSAMPYMSRKDKHLWTDLGNGMKHRSFRADFMQHAMPNIGVRSCGCLGNCVEIVPASIKAVTAIQYPAASLVLYK